VLKVNDNHSELINSNSNNSETTDIVVKFKVKDKDEIKIKVEDISTHVQAHMEALLQTKDKCSPDQLDITIITSKKKFQTLVFLDLPGWEFAEVDPKEKGVNEKINDVINSSVKNRNKNSIVVLVIDGQQKLANHPLLGKNNN
jgi:hypothetical protein